MVRTLEPREAEALIGAGDVEVIDVREPDEWAEGHIPAARNIPLDSLKADPRSPLSRPKVIFVCARGVRSLTAATLADQLKLAEVFSIEGGTQAWAKAGLPIEVPSAPAQVDSAGPSTLQPLELSSPDGCGVPEPTLDAVVGTNLRDLRTQRNLTLDALAQLTGLSRTLLGQIELGKASPSVSVVWKIARAFDVHFSALLAAPTSEQTRVLRVDSAKRLVSPDGRFSSRPLFNVGEKAEVEFYELYLAAQSREDAQPHQPGTRENLIVTTGRLELEVAGERFELAKGDAILFSADVRHSYVNPGKDDCWMYLVMTYAPRGG